jgi:hypothetical protein
VIHDLAGSNPAVGTNCWLGCWRTSHPARVRADVIRQMYARDDTRDVAEVPDASSEPMISIVRNFPRGQPDATNLARGAVR